MPNPSGESYSYSVIVNQARGCRRQEIRPGWQAHMLPVTLRGDSRHPVKTVSGALRPAQVCRRLLAALLARRLTLNPEMTPGLAGM